MDVYQKALNTKDGSLNRAQLQFNLADTLELMSRTEEAIEQYRMAVRLRSTELDGYLKLGLCLAETLGRVVRNLINVTHRRSCQTIFRHLSSDAVLPLRA